MSEVVSKAGIHCVGPNRNGYGDFLRRIDLFGRRLSIVKCRDNFGAIDEPLALWPDVLTIGAMTEWDDAALTMRANRLAGRPVMMSVKPYSAEDYNVDLAYTRILNAAALNPGIKLWEYLNERNGDWKQQADLYIALMPLLDRAHIGLCMFNCASGTPQYPWLDPDPYQQVARACQFAHDRSYNVMLGLHEYVSEYGADTIGRFKTMADYLEERDALIPIAITEWLTETYPGDTVFMDLIKSLDPIYMGDRRVVGGAIWTTGGGGWSESNFQSAFPQLGEYIATVKDMTMSKGGLHLSALGNHLDDDSLPFEIQAMKTAKITRAKWMSNGDPEFIHTLIAAGIDPAGCVVRLFAQGDNPVLLNPTEFYNQNHAYIVETYGHGVRMFEIHNEPNLKDEGYGYAWKTPAEFAVFYGAVAKLIKADFPNVQLIYPGLSPKDDFALWLPSITTLIAQGLVQLVGVHCYWSSAVLMRDASQGKTYLRFAGLGKDLIITEASHNVPNATDAQIGAEYAEYITTFPSYVNGVFFFVSYGPPFDASGETWVRGTGSTIHLTGIPAAVGAGIVPPPVGEWELDHWQDMDTGENLGSDNPPSILMDRNKNIRAITRPKVTPPVMVTLMAVDDGHGSVTGSGSYALNTMAHPVWRAGIP